MFNATIASVAVSGVLGVASALAGAGLWALVVQQLAYQIANCAALALQVRWRPRAIFDAGRAWRLFSFGWKLLASGLLDQGYQSLSDLIIGKQFSAGSLGLVSQGKKYPMACASGTIRAGNDLMMPGSPADQNDLLTALRDPAVRYPLTRANLERCGARIVETARRLAAAHAPKAAPVVAED